jgi:hypothetical protein
LSGLPIRARSGKSKRIFPYTFSPAATIQSDKKLAGVRVLIDRYRSAGITSIAHDFYPRRRHEMLHELNRRDVITNLLVWLSGILERSS